MSSSSSSSETGKPSGDDHNHSHTHNHNNDDDPPDMIVPFRRMRPTVQRSLAVVLCGLQGHRVVMELKNDVEVTGVVESADANMNTTLRDASQVSPDGTVVAMDVAFVQGSTVRYVHIPPAVPIVKHVEQYMKTVERVSKTAGGHKIIDRKRKAPAGEGGEDIVLF